MFRRSIVSASLFAASFPGHALALSCDDVALLIEAGTPLSIVYETVRASSPRPSTEDLSCLRSKGMTSDVVGKIADAAGLAWVKPSVAASTSADVAGPAPDAGAQLPAPSVRVSGMDYEHAAAAIKAGPDFAEKVSLYRRALCPSLETTTYQVDVAYESASQRTYVGVTTSGLPASPIRPYPGGRYLNVGCTSIVAAASCMAWHVDAVTLRQRLANADLAFAFSCDAYGARPVAMRLLLDGISVDVPIYKTSATDVVLEFPKNLPDGSKNGTARLIAVVGEEDWPP
ncbi:MAG: hypothetical protein Q8P41_15690 [Pseudomonadota bacterium]|nr:hypothetical protein [Pseudomonadota bacterium]